jgi:predicted small lipoprotein YifL
MKSVSTLLLMAGLIALSGCGEKSPASVQPSPQVQASESPSPKPTTTATATATATASPTPTPSASSTPTSTASTKPSAVPTASPSSTPKAAATLDRKAAFELLEKASELKDVYDEKSYTKSELYAYFAPYYTNNYVDKIILKNMKQVGDKWTLAHPNSELIEGSYYETNFTDKTKLEQTGDKIVITNSLEGGLSEAHEEKITLIQTNNGWRIDLVEWKM